MAMNPETGRIEPLTVTAENTLLRPDGTPVPKHWSVFVVDELVTIKDTTFRVAHIGEKHLLLEPLSAVEAADTLQDRLNNLMALASNK